MWCIRIFIILGFMSNFVFLRDGSGVVQSLFHFCVEMPVVCVVIPDKKFTLKGYVGEKHLVFLHPLLFYYCRLCKEAPSRTIVYFFVLSFFLRNVELAGGQKGTCQMNSCHPLRLSNPIARGPSPKIQITKPC